MKRISAVAAVTAVIAGAALLPNTVNAMNLGGGAGFAALAGHGNTELVARVCREWCNDSGVCRRRCVDRDDYGYDRDYRVHGDRRYHDRDYYDDRDRRPGVELRLGTPRY
jgi:hypothetical protein